MNPLRTIITGDAIEWLQKEPVQAPGRSFVASLPDFSEFPALSLEGWQTWFTQTAELILSRAAPDGFSIFFQTDIKHDGIWIDKAYLIQKAAEKQNNRLLFHKVFCRAPAGQTTFGKPAYSHLLAFSRDRRLEMDDSTADVIPSLGQKTWPRGMGFQASQAVVNFLRTQTPDHTIVNPFCGEGGLLALAEQYGIHSIGIEKSVKRAEKSRRTRANIETGRFWVDGDPSENADD